MAIGVSALTVVHMTMQLLFDFNVIPWFAEGPPTSVFALGTPTFALVSSLIFSLVS